MKGFMAVSLLAVLLVATAAAAPTAEQQGEETASRAPCQNVCTLEMAEVCGYDGTCYRSYGNKCAYDAEKCSRKSNLETVDISLCELARKDTHPNFKLCSDS